jgi:hypothetical protein
MMADEPSGQASRQVVQQRIRNRLIEYFEWVSSFEEQRRYQAAVPAVSVAGEVFEQWGDWVPEPATADRFGPVYSPDEVEAMLAYSSVMARAMPEPPTSGSHSRASTLSRSGRNCDERQPKRSSCSAAAAPCRRIKRPELVEGVYEPAFGGGARLRTALCSDG